MGVVVALPPGLGKTRIGLGLIGQHFPNTPVLLIVQKAIQEEWRTEARNVFGDFARRIVLAEGLHSIKDFARWSKEGKIMCITPELFTLISLLRSGKKVHPLLEGQPPRGRDLWCKYFHATFLDEAHLAVGLLSCSGWALHFVPKPIFCFTGKFIFRVFDLFSARHLFPPGISWTQKSQVQFPPGILFDSLLFFALTNSFFCNGRDSFWQWI